MPVSLNPETYVVGGLPLLDADVVWKETRFNMFNYPKKDGTPGGPDTVALRVIYTTDDGVDHEQQYSVGDPKRFTIAADGKTIEPVVAGTAMSKSSNAAILLNALVNAGFSAAKLEAGDVSVLDGIKTHNIGAPEVTRSGIEKPTQADGTPRPPLSIPGSIISDAGAAPAAPAAAAATVPDPDIVAKAVATVKTIVAANGPTDRKKMVTLMMTELAKDADKNKIAKAIYATGFETELIGEGIGLEGETFSTI